MRQSTRLIVNTAATFGRMATTVGVGLITTRWFLAALGQVDFGLLSVLGAAGALLGVVVISLNGSVQRHLAYEIGRGDPHQLAQVFSTSLAMFAGLGLLLWSIGVALTPLVMRGLTIPPERADAAWWTYQCSLLTLVLSVGLTPYQGLIVAHQELVVSSVLDVLGSVLRLGLVLSLFVLPWDRLVAYSMMNVGLTGLMGSLAVGWSLWRYVESRPRPGAVSRVQLGRLARFAGWVFLWNLAWTLRQQGGAVLLNLRFGPGVNAAYAVAGQVTVYAGNLSWAIVRAVQPVIVGMEARGGREQVRLLALTTSRFCTLLVGSIFVPVWLESPMLLRLWLGDVPPHTLELVRWTIPSVVMTYLVSGHALALEAHGEIGHYSRVVFGLVTAELVVAGLGLWGLGWEPWSLPACVLLGTVVNNLMQARMIGRMVGLSSRIWVNQVLAPVVIVLGTSALAGAAVLWLLPQTAWRVPVTGLVTTLLALPMTWKVGIRPDERQHFQRIARSGIHRIGLQRR